MTKDEALRLALGAMKLANSSHDTMLLSDPPQSAWRYHNVDMKLREAIIAIKATLEANEFNPDWDTQSVMVEEIQRMAKRIEELEAQREPVAWVYESVLGDDFGTPSYAKNIRPQRTWVGLTDEEVTTCHSLAVLGKKHDGTDPSFTTLLHRQIEAKLKDKNYGS